MREGMIFYLGVYIEYNVELLDVFIFNYFVIVIRYKNYVKGVYL